MTDRSPLQFPPRTGTQPTSPPPGHSSWQPPRQPAPTVRGALVMGALVLCCAFAVGALARALLILLGV